MTFHLSSALHLRGARWLVPRGHKGLLIGSRWSAVEIPGMLWTLVTFRRDDVTPQWPRVTRCCGSGSGNWHEVKWHWNTSYLVTACIAVGFNIIVTFCCLLPTLTYLKYLWDLRNVLTLCCSLFGSHTCDFFPPSKINVTFLLNIFSFERILWY